jgi:TolB-like protein/thioredoxin-like negative regulator of GroEL
LNFFSELKRRNVYKVAVAYAVIAWLLIQAASILFPTFEAPAWVMKVFVTVVAAGFPIALVLAWAFEMTPQGMKRTENVSPNEVIPYWSRRKFAALIVTVAFAAAALLAFQFFRTKGSPAAALKKDPSSVAATIPQKSIAVLPFASLSEDKANEYFANGIQDEILTRLAKIADLKVISRTSTQQYQSKPGNIPEIARQLGVAHILEGSVQKSGESVRVNVQLIKAEGDSHLWAETFDRKLTDIFAVETEVAQKIANSLEAHLTGGEQRQIANVPTRNPQAYDAYLRGLALIIRQSNENVAKGRDYLQQAVELDPGYAQAWAQLSIAESELYFGDEQTPERLERARHAAETAVRLQPELGDAHSALGLFYYFCLQDFDRALLELAEARKYSPNDGNAIFYTGLVKRRQGKLDEAIELVKKATSFDPRNPDMWVNLARSYRGKRDFKTAREMFDRAFAVSPDEVQFVAEKAETYTAEGKLDEAKSLLRGQDLTQSDIAIEANVEMLIYQRRFDDAIQMLSKALEQRKTSPLQAADGKSWLGGLHLLAGHQSEARALLEEARKELLALRDKGETSWRLNQGLIWTNAALNDRQAMEREVPEFLSRTQHDLWRAPAAKATLAGAYALLGDADRAIPFLQEALSSSYHQSITLALVRLDPIWDRIRKDPRFQQLIADKPKL